MVTPIGAAAPVAETLPLAVDRIVRALDPEKIVLFGSYAYGDPNPHSDVDLLVIMATNAPSAQRYMAVSDLLVPRPFPVDILVKTPAEVAHALEGGDFFIREILTQGRTLYDRGH